MFLGGILYFLGVGIVDGIDVDGKLKVKWSCGMESSVKPNNVISESILFGDAFDDMNFGANDDDGFALTSDDENVDGGDGEGNDDDSDDWVSCDSSSSGIDVKGKKKLPRDLSDNILSGIILHSRNK